MGAMPSCVAPPAASNAAVAFPCWILLTRAMFAPRGFGTRQTLASYLSMHPAPDTTASSGHFVSAPPGGAAAPAALASSASAAAAALRFRNEIITLPLFLPLETTRER